MSKHTQDLVSLLILTGKSYGVLLNEDNLKLWVNDLRELAFDYGIGYADIEKAFKLHKRCLKHGSFMPKLADIVRNLPVKQDDYPKPAEAWAIAIKAKNEASSVCWTPLIAQAFFEVKALLDLKDVFGARAGFVATYERLVNYDKTLPFNDRKNKWVISLGTDAELRDVVIEQAVQQQRLSNSVNNHLLLNNNIADVDNEKVEAIKEKIKLTVKSMEKGYVSKVVNTYPNYGIIK